MNIGVAVLILLLSAAVHLHSAELRVEAARGKCEYRRESEWRPMRDGLDVGRGYFLRTGIQSSIVLTDGVITIRAGELSTVEIVRTGGTAGAVTISLTAGKLMFEQKTNQGQHPVQAYTPFAALSARSASFGIAYSPQSQETRCAVFSGDAVLINRMNPAQSLRFGESQRLAFIGSAIPDAAEALSSIRHMPFWNTLDSKKRVQPIIIEKEKRW